MIVVPSGRVTLVVEKLSPGEDPVVTDDPALLVVDPPLELPPTVVVEDTLPDPAVTEDETPPFSDDFCSMMVQVEPSSSLISFASAKKGAETTAAKDTATATNGLEVMTLPFLKRTGPGTTVRSQSN